ncbi:MAG: 3-dehydroquinate synthase family protein [Exilispira sp.]
MYNFYFRFDKINNLTKVFLKNQSNNFEVKIEEILNIILENILINYSYDKILFLIDKNITNFYFEKNTIKILDTKDKIKYIFFEIDEYCKDINFIIKLWEIFNDNELSRKSFIIAIGGGTLLDITGFAASTYKRGIHFGFIPTTFLSMIDASFGGKNAVNFKGIKNLIGTTNQPDFILLIPFFLYSLSDIDFISGFAEFTKYLLLDNSFYGKFFINLIKFNKKDRLNLSKDKNLNIFYKNDHNKTEKFSIKELKEFITQNPLYLIECLKIKYKYVKNDLLDYNRRHILNLGHTVSHGIELVLNLSHGLALYTGLFLELKIINKLKISNNLKIIEKVNKIYETFELPYNINEAFKMQNNMELDQWLSENNLSRQNLYEIIIKKIHQDKKNKDNSYIIPFFDKRNNIKLKKIDYKIFDDALLKLLD